MKLLQSVVMLGLSGAAVGQYAGQQVSTVLPSGYTHVTKACVHGSNIDGFQGVQTVAECEARCDADPNCLAFEYGVPYGGPVHMYNNGMCRKQSGSFHTDCDGVYFNFDLYIKPLAPTNGQCGSQMIYDDACLGNNVVLSPDDTMAKGTTGQGWKSAFVDDFVNTEEHEDDQIWTFTLDKMVSKGEVYIGLTKVSSETSCPTLNWHQGSTAQSWGYVGTGNAMHANTNRRYATTGGTFMYQGDTVIMIFSPSNLTISYMIERAGGALEDLGVAFDASHGLAPGIYRPAISIKYRYHNEITLGNKLCNAPN